MFCVSRLIWWSNEELIGNHNGSETAQMAKEGVGNQTGTETSQTPTPFVASFESLIQGRTREAFNKLSYWLLGYSYHYLLKYVGHLLLILAWPSG